MKDDDRPSAPPSSTTLDVHFVIEREARALMPSRGVGWQRRLRTIIESLWAAEQADRGGQIGVVFVGADRMRELNRTYRGADRPTDVLSFDLSDVPDMIEGEIYLCTDLARRQAERLGFSLLDEVARLVIHGLLHFAGYDHHTPADGRRMAAATRRWLARWQSEHEPVANVRPEGGKW